MAKTQKRETGDLGESVVCKFLQQRGYSIVERNYLRPWGEIDIVAREHNTLRFVEVKTVTREPEKGGLRPEENMHKSKIQKLQRVIHTYLSSHKEFCTLDWQIDLACVYLNLESRKARVELIECVY